MPEDLRYLSHLELKTLTALAEVLVIGEDEKLTPEEVGLNVDGYLATFSARRKWVVRIALLGLLLYPLLKLRPPLPTMAPQERLDFVKRHFLTDVAERRISALWRWLVQAMIRLAQQLVYLGYYGDEDTFASVGYVRFSDRPRFEDARRRIEQNRPRVAVLAPADLRVDTIQADVLVIGSGAAGAILGYRIAEAGRQVLMLERGKHVDPSEFSEDEKKMFSELYSDGALQLSSDFRFQVLQGMCVGGTTVVNNAVCFDLPDQMLRAWNDPNLFDAGLDEAELKRSFETVRGLTGVREPKTPLQSQSGESKFVVREQSETPLQKGWKKFDEGVRKLGLDAPPNLYGVVDANLVDCLGSGYCNIGCGYGKKLSMLDTVLPWAQQRFGPDGLRIVSECQAERIVASGGRAEAVICELSDGRKLRVNAGTIVVAGGAISSSLLLQRSKLGGSLVGRNVGYNIGSPMTADFDEELNAYDGLQMTHYLQPVPDRGFALETWFNPVMSQALAMPGWFEDHYRNMHRYAHMTAAGVLVGTDHPYLVGTDQDHDTLKKLKNRRVRATRVPLTGGFRIDFEPTEGELEKLKDGLKLAGQIFLAAGARRVMPTTLRYHEFSSDSELERLDQLIKDDSDVSLGSAHPQGGNALSRNPDKGVVDPSFCVHGFENLYVCDASVFPSSIGVNPQLTVMALADYAAPLITQRS